MAAIAGRGRSWLRGPDGTRIVDNWRPNRVVRSGIDLVADLIIGAEDRGATWLAIGTGDEAWDGSTPVADPGRISLVGETARVRLRPGTTALRYGRDRRVLQVRGRFEAGIGTGPIREVGIFAGTASARLGSGRLLNHLIHPVIDKGLDDVLVRDIEIEISDGIDATLAELLGAALANEMPRGALLGIAIGTDPRAVARSQLRAEQFRRATSDFEVRYNADRAIIEVTTEIDSDALHHDWPRDDNGDPHPVREVGLVLGSTILDAPIGLRTLIPAQAVADAMPLVHRFELPLGSDASLVVKNVVGELVDEAAQSLVGAGFVLGHVDEINRPGVSARTVLKQSPAAGTTAPELSRVDVVIARRLTNVVPAVVGLEPAKADQLIRQKNLTVGSTVEVEVDAECAGLVVQADPVAGTVVDRGTAVDLIVGRVRAALMPRVVGLSIEAARRALAAANFVGNVLVSDTPQPTGHGTVIGQNPDEGTAHPLDVIVRLRAATPVMIDTPGIVELTIDEATTRVKKLSDEISAKYGLANTTTALSIGSIRSKPVDVEPSVVLQQSPAKGEPTPMFGSIDVVIAVGAKVAVPNLIDREEHAATTVLDGVGLRVGPIRQRSVLTDPGKVVDQEPKAGTILRVGQPVSITVAATAEVVVPNLIGSGLDAAIESLAARSLRMGEQRVGSGEGTPGSIIKQQPPAGTKVDAGSVVAIQTLGGVPAVVGLQIEKAKQVIAKADLSAEVTESAGAGEPGIVVAQSPLVGSSRPSNGVMSLTVAVAATVEVPQLVGLPSKKAMIELKAKKLEITIVGTERGAENIPVGAIVRQDPAAGFTVPTGTSVQVWLQRTQQAITPDLLGMKADKALVVLEEVGLTGFEGDPVDRDGEPGTVGAQQPEAGVNIELGRAVQYHLIFVKQVRVPDMTSAHVAEAKRTLGELGLGVSVIDPYANSDIGQMDRHVSAQKPRGGTFVDRGTRVELSVGVLLPSLVGTSYQKVAIRLKQLELRVDVRDETGERKKEGLILATDPVAGAIVAPGHRLVVIVESVDPGRGPLDDVIPGRGGPGRTIPGDPRRRRLSPFGR